jgi:peptidoglycan hydrolase CwlO-like protein
METTIATLDGQLKAITTRIEVMERMIDGMVDKIDSIQEKISSDKLNNDAVASMNKKWKWNVTGLR